MAVLDVLLPKQIEELDREIQEVGGTAYIVGGAVLDLISRKEVKDWDIEVAGLSYEQLLKVSGEEADLIGAKFGVVKVNRDGLDIELATPRVENSTGPKHIDFDIKLAPTLSIEEAAVRRDFTMNAVYFEIGNRKVHDPYGGLKDYRRGIVSHISDDTFIEDPLRVFRAMQFVARKCKRVAKETTGLCSTMKDMCKELTGDSIYGEFVKMLMLSDRPDRGLRFLEESGIINMFPELSALIDCPQKEKWHPEGDAWTHTQMVVREAAQYRDELPEEWKLPFMFGMLLHDVGKPITLDPKKLTTYSHDYKGMPIARTFMERLTKNEKLIKRVERIVGTHMRAKTYLKSKAKASAWRKLHNQCPLHVLAYVSVCDLDGRGIDPSAREGKKATVFKECMRMHNAIGSYPDDIPPVLLGRHLIEAGHKPGIEFGTLLNKAYEIQLETGYTNPQELLKVVTNG